MINAAAEHLQAEGTVQFLDCIYSDRNVPEHLEEFLDGMLFEKTERPLPIWKFLSSSVQLPEEADRLIGRSGVFRLRELTYEQKKGVMKLLSGIDSLKPFDTQFSLVRMLHEEAEGVLLTRDVAGTLEISWLYARKNNPLTLLALLAELNMEIHNVYKDQEICLTAAAINDTSEQLIRKLVPDAERLYVKRAVCEL